MEFKASKCGFGRIPLLVDIGTEWNLKAYGGGDFVSMPIWLI